MEATPRSLLSDYLKTQDHEPLYIEMSPAFPDPLSTKSMFQVGLSVFDGEYEVTGIGHNRREAKQEAAKKMLIILAAHKPGVNKLLNDNNFDSMMEKSYTTKTDTNVLQSLNALCQLNKFSVHFSLVKEAGEAHNKQYTVRCEVSDFKVEGTRKTLKGAKLACAKKMIEIIEGQKGVKTKIPENFKVSYDNQDELQGDMDILASVLKPRLSNPISGASVKLSKLHLLETETDCNIIPVLNAVKREKSFDHDMFCRYLDFDAPLSEIKAIIVKLDREADVTVKITVLDFPQFKDHPIPKFLVHVRFFNQGVSKTFSGFGANKFESEKKAYINLLKYLSCMEPNTSGRSVMIDNTSSDED